MFGIEILSAIAVITGLSVKELSKKLADYRQRGKDIQDIRYQQERRRQFADIFRNNLDTTLLRQYYERRNPADDSYFYSYSVDGKSIHTNALTRPSWNERIISLDIDDGSCRLVDEPLKVVLPDINKVSRLLAVVEGQNLQLEDRPIYRMTDFKLDASEYQSTFAVTDFFTYKFTMGLVIDELYEALIEEGHDCEHILEDRMNCLSIREMLLPSRSAILSPRHRICAGGVFVVFAAARPSPHNDYYLVTQIRSSKVADNQNSISVIPRAFHQHMCNRRVEANVLHTVYREIYEELFGGEEVEGGSTHIQPGYYFENCEALKWLLDNRHNIAIELVSYGFNALSGNYEYGILFAIHDPTFWKKYGGQMKINWESIEPDLHPSGDRAHLSTLLIDGNWATETLPPMIEGLMRLKELCPSKVQLPEITRLTGNRS